MGTKHARFSPARPWTPSRSATATGTKPSPLIPAPGNWLSYQARHRAHARVEDRIRTGKDTGLGHLPSRHQNINGVWTELALVAADLLALAQSMLLTNQPELHRAEPKTLRYRLLHTAARITRGQRRVFLRLAALALGAGPRQSLHPPAANPASGLTASTTATPHPKEDHGDTGPRAGPPCCPDTASAHPRSSDFSKGLY